jgi:G3E family GTPase
MNLFVIAGFLGSGKTSLLLAVAKAVSESGRRMAVIENEAGKIGIDGIVLSETGLQVREIYSGCVCCSLRIDLINTLLELEKELAPDIVFLEPSGVASPKQVLLALNGYGGEIERKHVAVVIDAERFLKLADLNIPIITDGIEIADILVINKTDRVSQAELDSVSARITEMRRGVRIIYVSALNNTNVHLLVEEFMAVPCGQKSQTKVPVLARSRQGLQAVPVTRSYALSAGEPGCENINSRLAEILKNIAADLERAACQAIGHIKAVVKAAEGGYLLFSVTAAGKEPDVKGRLPGKITSLQIVLNVIVYGIDASVVEGIVDSRLGNTERMNMDIFQQGR